MPTNPIIDRIAQRLEAAGLLTARIDDVPWIDGLATELARRLPQSFSSLVQRYAFRPFEWGAVAFFGNANTDDNDSLHRAATRDPAIWQATRKASLLQIGRPADGSYDPICFDLRVRERESPIVRLDHEAILMRDRIAIRLQIAPSFGALAEILLADGSAPTPFES